MNRGQHSPVASGAPPPAPAGWKQRISRSIRDQLTRGVSPRKVSLTLALGMALGVFPILGAATLLCFLVAMLFRLNQPVIQTANWLVKALHQRAQTIMKVASTIVERQELFFTKGVQYLKPLILRDISEAVEIHESTVSRATTNKYISTPRGMFELKYFFTASIAASGDGEAHSAEAVRHRIKALVDAEQANAILSDDTIVDLLREDGVDIARRTVAKYREALRIPSSVKRRRLKAMA